VATSGTKVPSIYKVPSKADPELKLFADSVKEALEVRLGRRGDPRDRAVTLRELIDSGLAQSLTNNPFDPNVGVRLIDFEPRIITDYTTPPAPTGFTVAASYTAFILAWDPIPLGNTWFAYTEVWRNAIDDLSTATRVDTTSAAVWSESAGYDTTYYYWVRHVSTSGIEGPFTGPKSGTTSEDIAAVMEQLSQELANLPGYNTLLDTDVAGLISTAKAEAIAGGAYIIRATSAPTTRDDSGTTALQQYDIWVDTDDNNQMYLRNVLNQPTNGTAANTVWVKARDATLTTLVGDTSFTGSTISAAMALVQVDVFDITEDMYASSGIVSTLSTTVETKPNTFAQNTVPTSTAIGDLWIDTNDNNTIYRAAAVGADEVATEEWEALPPSTLKTFAQPNVPTSITIGDLWIDTDDDNKMYRANAVDVNTIVTTGDGWYLLDDARIKTTADAFEVLNTAVTGEEGYASQLTILNAAIITKAGTFAQPNVPTSVATGDIWIDTDDDNKMYRANAVDVDTIVTTGDGWYALPDGRITTTAQTVGYLSTAVGLSGASSTKIVALESTVNHATTGVVANANAISTLDTSVTIKSSTYVSDSAPVDDPEGTLKEGDLWVNTTNEGNALSTWNDSIDDWYQIRDGTIAIAQGAAETAQGAAETAAGAAATAQGAAVAAAGVAATATNTLADIADDNKLTPAEKQQAKTLWDAVATEYAGIVASALATSSTPSTAYTTAYNNLNTYLNTTPDVFDDMDVTTTISRTTWNARWVAYYDAKQALLDAIAAALKAIADSKAQTFVHPDEPADNSTNNLKAGDIWIDTNSDPVNLLHIWDDSGNGEWVPYRDGMVTATASSITGINAAITNLSGGAQTTFAQDDVPDGGSVAVKAGDLWIDTNSSPANQVYRATANDAAAIVTSGNGWLLTDIQGTTASVTTISQSVATLAGDANAAYVLQVNANGSVAGMVIENTASTNNDGNHDNSGSAIQFRADKFAIWNATGTDAGSGSVAPFIVDNDIVYIDTARIQNASITAAQIGSLNADVINAGSMNATRIGAGTFHTDRFAANSIHTDCLKFGNGTVVTSDGLGEDAILTIVNNGIVLDHIASFQLGRMASIDNLTQSFDVTTTGSMSAYTTSAPYHYYTSEPPKGGGGTTYHYMGGAAGGQLSLDILGNTIIETGAYVVTVCMQYSGVPNWWSSSTRSGFAVNITKSTSGSSVNTDTTSSEYTFATREMTGDASYHYAPKIRQEQFEFTAGCSYRISAYFYGRTFGGTPSVSSWINVMRVNSGE